MSDMSIQVTSVGKRYRLGAAQKSNRLSEKINQWISRPWRLFRRDLQAEADEESRILWALKNISFDVKQGEVVGIVGRNGAGKSTMLKVLSRITEPTEGEIQIWGRVGSLLEVGTGFHPELTGRENIYLNGAILGMKRAEIDRKFDEIVAFSEVEKFIDTAVKFYSSGMYMRLAFAVAAHLEPEILVIDEVLAVGDAQFQKKCLGKLDDVARQGRTILFVSHNMQAVSSLCTRAILMKKGELAMDGLPGPVIAEYLGDSVGDSMSSWKGEDGDGYLALRSTQVISSSKDGIFRTDEAVLARLTMEVRQPVIGLVCALEIYNISGSKLVYTNYDDVKDPPPEVVNPGTYTWEITIPANNFAAGDYVFDFDLGIHMVRRSSTGLGKLSVRFENLEGIGRRFLAATDLLRPKWEWKLVNSRPLAEPTI